MCSVCVCGVCSVCVCSVMCGVCVVVVCAVWYLCVCCGHENKPLSRKDCEFLRGSNHIFRERIPL